MKTLLCSLLLWFAIISVQAQTVSETLIPAPARTTFAEAYPTAKKVKWDKEKSHYEANFEQAGVNHSVLFSEKGEIMETEMEIPVSRLPQGVATYVAAHYKGQKIKEAAKITNNKGEITYEAEIKGKDLIFDSNGKIINEGTENNHD